MLNTFYLHGCGQCAVHYENETLIAVKCSVVYTMKFRKFIHIQILIYMYVVYLTETCQYISQ